MWSIVREGEFIPGRYLGIGTSGETFPRGSFVVLCGVSYMWVLSRRVNVRRGRLLSGRGMSGYRW